MEDGKYVCPICDEFHDRDKLCPIVWNKIKNNKRRTFSLGGMFLECVKQEKDFISILNEAVYYYAYMGKRGDRLINTDFIIDYFANELNCNPGTLMKNASVLAEECVELFNSFCPSWDFDFERNKYYSFSTTDFDDVMRDERRRIRWPRELVLQKELNGDKQWEYSVELISNMDDFEISCFEKIPFCYFFLDSDGASRNITLVKITSGVLADYFENEFNSYWKNTAELIPYSDNRYNVWIKKLHDATINKLLEWRRYETNNRIRIINYYTTYQNKEIHFEHIERNGAEDTTLIMYIRYDREMAFEFLNYVERENARVFDEKNRLKQLESCIDHSISEQNNRLNTNDLSTKVLSDIDVIIRSSSMYCRHDNHMINSVAGRVPLMTDSGIIFHEVYLGHCETCGVYLMFPLDYEKMLSLGEPQCKTYVSFVEKEKNESEFIYNSKSLLRKKGYSVQDKNGLSQTERQAILLNVINERILTPYEVITFLNWLVNTRKTQNKYQAAVNKWKEDIQYVKNLSKNAEKVAIRSITGKIYRD